MQRGGAAYNAAPMRQFVWWLVMACAGCSRAPVATPQGFRPSEVSELGALPPGYEAGPVVRASCSRLPVDSAFSDAPFSAVDCSFARLSRVLRAQAGELSAKVIVGKRCQSRGSQPARLTCSATAAVAGPQVALALGSAPVAGPAPSADQVLDIDEPRPQDQDRIQVGFLPAAGRSVLPPRNYAAVDETHWASVGRREVGQVSARCASCDASTLRYALRATAGRVGAGEVAQVKCFQDAGELRCVGTALAPWSS